jgi:hypothetical protein
MLDAAFVLEEEKYKLVREGVFHLSFLDGLIVKEINGEKKTKYGHTYRMDPKVKMPLCTWGEGGVIKIVGGIKGKLKPRGTAAMFVGYARDSAHNTMNMYAPDLNSIHETRDVQWSRKMYYEPEKVTQLEAVNSVEIMLNNMRVLVRTNRRAEVQEAARLVVARGPVSFCDEVEIILLWSSSSPAPRLLQREDPLGGHQVESGQGMLVEVGQEIEEDLLTMTSSLMNKGQRSNMIGGWECL